MKKMIFGGIAVLVIAVAIAFNVNISSQKDKMSSLSLANITALAQESGTSVDYCYLRLGFGYTNRENKKFCSDETKSDKIFPCPSGSDYDGFSELAKDRCTN